MIPFSPPRIDQAIIDAVSDTLKSGWITTGPGTKEFEKRLASYCGNGSTLCVNSATAGLEIMLRWFGVGEGDEVIVPAYTYCATANVVIHCGAKPVMIDSGPDFNMDVTKLKSLITSKTKVVIPVDFGGLPCDYDRINKVVSDQNIRMLFKPSHPNQEKLGRIMILSDAAHSIGGRFNGRMTGSLTDVTVFSFHAVKNLTTAEGGAIALNFPYPFINDEIYRELAIYTLHGQSKDALAKMQKGNWKYDVSIAGYKCNMTDISAAIGLIELGRYEDDMLAKRKHICESYNNYFNLREWAQLPLMEYNGAVSSMHLYPLRINGINENRRDEIINRIFNQDVSVNVHFIPLPMLSLYRESGYKITDFPAAYDAFSREISLPVYYDLTDEQVKEVCRAVTVAVESVLT